MADIPYEGTVFGANSVIGHLIGMAVPVEVWKSSEVTLQRMVRRSSSSFNLDVPSACPSFA